VFTLELTREQRDVVALCRELATRELRPAAKEAESDRPAFGRVLARVAATGVIAAVPEEFGGPGVSEPLTHLLVAEELAYGDPGIAFEACGAALVARLIAACGSAEQRSRVLPALATGNASRPSLLLYEGFGRSPLELATTATATPGGWTLRGAKTTVLHPGVADVAVVVARVDSGDGIGAYLLDAGDVARSRVTRDDLAAGKLGLRGTHTGNVTLDLAVGEGAWLADAGVAAIQLHREVALARLTLAAIAVGTASAAIDYAVDYAGERVAFGQPIIAYQGVAFPLTDLMMQRDAARLALWNEALTLGHRTDPAEIADATGAVVALAGAAALDAGRQSVNTLGGHGFLADHPVERWYRAAVTLGAIDSDPLWLQLAV
jgi:acyl-CoA dehydrogenase